MEISKLFEKFNIPEKFNGDRFSPFADKVFTILVTISFIFPIIYIIFNNSSYSIIGSIMTYLIGVLILFIVSLVIATILSSITPKYTPDSEFFPNKELLIQDKKAILSHISELSNISSIYPYLTFNLESFGCDNQEIEIAALLHHLPSFRTPRIGIFNKKVGSKAGVYQCSRRNFIISVTFLA